MPSQANSFKDYGVLKENFLLIYIGSDWNSLDHFILLSTNSADLSITSDAALKHQCDSRHRR